MMNKFAMSAACTLSLLFSGDVQARINATKSVAAAEVVARPALWAVKDADTTIYLFGTIHALKPNIAWYRGTVQSAFEASQEAVFELIDQDDPAVKADMQKTVQSPAGPPLSEKLAPADRARYQKAMSDLGIPWQSFERLKPWAVMVTATIMPLIKDGYDVNSGVDKVLMDKARAQKKQLTGLETAKIQLGFFEQMDEKLQIEMLNETIKALPKAGKTIGAMVDHWAKAKPDALAIDMNAGLGQSPEIKRILLTDRNARWADWIDARMQKPGIVFLSVGAAHLAGKDSVQAYLSQHHLKAVRAN